MDPPYVNCEFYSVSENNKRKPLMTKKMSGGMVGLEAILSSESESESIYINLTTKKALLRMNSNMDNRTYMGTKTCASMYLTEKELLNLTK